MPSTWHRELIYLWHLKFALSEVGALLAMLRHWEAETQGRCDSWAFSLQCLSLKCPQRRERIILTTGFGSQNPDAMAHLSVPPDSPNKLSVFETTGRGGNGPDSLVIMNTASSLLYWQSASWLLWLAHSHISPQEAQELTSLCLKTWELGSTSFHYFQFLVWSDPSSR